MKQKKGSCISTVFIGLIAFIAGSAFGLVILGWWLWPVQWQDSNYPSETMPATPTPAKMPALPTNLDFTNLPNWFYYCLAGAALIIFFLLLILLILRGRSTKNSQASKAAVVSTYDTPVENAAGNEPLIQPEDAYQSFPSELTPAPSPDRSPQSEEAELSTSELPEWLVESSDSAITDEDSNVSNEVNFELSDEDIDAITGESEFTAPYQTEFESSAFTSTPIETPAQTGPAFQAFTTSPSDDSKSDTDALKENETRKFSLDIESVNGVDHSVALALKSAGIGAPLLLLRNGSTAAGRTKIATQTGISEDQVLKAVHFVDLFRISGISPEIAHLLNLLGVDTVEKLAQNEPQALYLNAFELNWDKSFLNRDITRSEVEDWILQAQRLPPAVTF